MASKRRQRRRAERLARLKMEREQQERELEEKLHELDLEGDMAYPRNLQGNVGRTSVADLILQRHKFLSDKPTIQVVQPAQAPPLTPPGKDKQPPQKVAGAASPALHEEKEKEKKPAPATKPASSEETAAGSADPIIASQRHKEMIWKEAKENRDYYLLKQMEDGEKHPWFFYVKKESQYSEFVMLDTRMGQALLDHIWTESEGNRRLKIWLKDGYKRDILNDRWIPSDEAIGIDYNGIVYNGRHRLTALVESGKEWPFYITFNALEEAKFTVDSGAKRNSSEKMRLVIDTRLGNRTSGFCKALMRGLQSRVRYTESEIVEFAHKWQPVIDWISQHLPSARAEVQAAVAKAYLYYGPEQVEPFCARLREIKFTEDGDPARALFVALQRAKVNRINQTLVAYKKTLNALDATVHKKTLAKLYESDDDIFVWEDDWKVPKESWWHRSHNEQAGSDGQAG